LDVVSLEKSKGLGDELSSFTCPILNHSGDALRVMLKQCNLQAKIGSNLAPYCITRLTYLLTISIITMVFVFRIDTKEKQRTKLEESTSGYVVVKSKVSVPLVTQGICDLLAGRRRKKLKA